MTSPPPPAKSSTRWGSFLQQAVAGVESRLDTILADEENTSSRPPKTKGNAPEPVEREAAKAAPVVTKPRGDSLSRDRSNSRKNDRLQERLAKAMVNRNAIKVGDSSVTSSNPPSRTASPANTIHSPRSSSDQGARGAKGDGSLYIDPVGRSVEPPISDNVDAIGDAHKSSQSTVDPPEHIAGETTVARLSIDSQTSLSSRQSFDCVLGKVKASNPLDFDPSEPGAELKAPTEYEEIINQMRSDYEVSELRRQEEMHLYLERIDALQSKLQYLTNEAVDFARKATSEAEPGSADQKLAAKEEKIALLLEEGQKLSQTELKHMSIIKKLRAKSAEEETRSAESKNTIRKYEKSIREAQERSNRAEIAEKRASEKVKSLYNMEKELESLRADRDQKAATIKDLQNQVTHVATAAKAAEATALADSLGSERQLTAELREQLSEAKMEKESSNEIHQVEIRDLKDKAKRDKERARITEMELRSEQGVLERRLEAFRARIEEASAGTIGDSQAKLLRQVETLQNQYAIASENWQGIEGSLLSRVTALENEKDDIAKREADVRRKARETSIRSRRLEEELDKATTISRNLEGNLSERSTQLATIHEKLARVEADLTDARLDLEAQKAASEARQAHHVEETTRTRDENVRPPDVFYPQYRADSPLASQRNASTPDRFSPHSRRLQGLPSLSGGTSLATPERPQNRRASAYIQQNSELSSRSRQNSLSSVPQVAINGSAPETPFAPIDQQEDFFDGVITPATPERTINDMISVSTAGAGPSVQLVERMSAAVRRLESEKATSRDELHRLSTQRDEAREQAVSLMREAEEKRAADEKIKALEAEMSLINERYQTTLEMLGEKSERVGELEADVADVKQMYRELVDSTMH